MGGKREKTRKILLTQYKLENKDLVINKTTDKFCTEVKNYQLYKNLIEKELLYNPVQFNKVKTNNNVQLLCMLKLKIISLINFYKKKISFSKSVIPNYLFLL